MLRFLFWSTAIALSSSNSFAQEIQNILNAASYTQNVAPGTWVAIFGIQLASGPVAAQSVPFPVQLGQVSVTFAGVAAPLSYVSASQINALVPFEAAILSGTQTTTVQVIVTTPAGASPAFKLTLARNAPAIFTKNLSGSGNALVFDPYFNPVSIVGNSPIVLYATGLGPTIPVASTNAVGAAAEPLNRVQDPVIVSVGQNFATVLFAGLAPNLQGIYQINLLPNPILGNSLSVSAGAWAGNPVTVPVTAGTNVSNVTGSIDALYPSGVKTVTFSALLTEAAFTTSFDILPGARPFQVLAQGTPGSGVSATININPAQGTWQATYTVPGAAERAGDFSSAGFVVTDFLSGRPFPGNIIPLSRLDPAAMTAVNLLPLPNIAAVGANSTFGSSGALPPNGHFVIGAGVQPNLSSFGGYVNIAHFPGANTASFQLFVDNLPVASRSIIYNVD